MQDEEKERGVRENFVIDNISLRQRLIHELLSMHTLLIFCH
jgi:hypothetical protein